MAKQEVIEVGYYLGKTPRERIDYLIDNYSRMREIIEAYRSNLESDIAIIRMNERRKNNVSDICVMSNNPFGDVTSAMAMENDAISQAMEKGYIDPGFIKSKYDMYLVNQALIEWQTIKREFQRISSMMILNLSAEEKRIFMSHIDEKKSIPELALEYGIEKESVYKRVYRIRQRLVKLLLKKYGEDNLIQLNVAG